MSWESLWESLKQTFQGETDLNPQPKQSRALTGFMEKMFPPKVQAAPQPTPQPEEPARENLLGNQNMKDPYGSPVFPYKESPIPDYVPQVLASVIDETAKQYNINPILLAEILRKESIGFQDKYVYGPGTSPVGAQGVAQFMPDTASWLGEKMGKSFDPWNPNEAIPAAGYYLNMLRSGGGNEAPVMLASYNAGPGRARSARAKLSSIPNDYTLEDYLKELPPETQSYVSDILARTYQSAGVQNPR